MSKNNDGGPAFPSGKHGQILGVMSLRDWFAGQALAGYIANNRHSAHSHYSTYASHAYDVADAMLLKREEDVDDEVPE